MFTALPQERSEIDNLHRTYIANVIYTMVGEDFRNWVDNMMKERTKRITQERDMNIKMDPEIYQIFKNSTSVSSK